MATLDDDYKKKDDEAGYKPPHKDDDDKKGHDKKKHKVDAKDDYFSGDEDTTIKGNVLSNDTDSKYHDLDVAYYTKPKYGTLELDKETGDFTYTPNPNFYGKDYFKYKVVDEKGKTDWATVKLDVKDVPENQKPVAEDDKYKVKETKKLYGDVSKNDSDPDGDELTYSLVGDAPKGLYFNDDGTFYFKPEKDKDRYDEKVTFTYRATDEGGLYDDATVTIYVKDNWGKKKYDDKYDHKDDHKDDHYDKPYYEMS